MSDSELKQHVRNTHGGLNPNSSNTMINSNQQHHSQQKQQQEESGHPQIITVLNPVTPREGVPSTEMINEGARGMVNEEEQVYVPATPSYANIMDSVRK
ncbi:unnamed protein product [Ceratitis capitata]|uniref:(Mediterranean fruit fly) hypothetical protein n=1 Tax=Ceratitis capitata TaxID=7213 RepID=A0A811USM4_CERCA|nr:unnamed protein product [Ceratitis capitata]